MRSRGDAFGFWELSYSRRRLGPPLGQPSGCDATSPAGRGCGSGLAVLLGVGAVVLSRAGLVASFMGAVLSTGLAMGLESSAGAAGVRRIRGHNVPSGAGIWPVTWSKS